MGALLLTLGVLAAIAIAAIVWMFVAPTLQFAYKGVKATTEPTPITRRQQTVVAYFPTSGNGETATKDRPLKAYLNPKRTHTRPEGPARYVFAADSSIYFDEDKKPNPATDEKWRRMPPGNYLIHPRGVNEVTFSWWMD